MSTVTLYPATPVIEQSHPGLLRGIVFGVAVQTAAIGAIASSWMLLRHL